LPAADFFAFVCRAGARPMAEVYAWSLRDVLPILPVPLVDADPDARLDLQSVCTAVYDRGGYDYALDYTQPVDPPLSDADTDWLRERLAPVAPPVGE